ncbi:uncharacterized protein LOC130667175 [Microplitis mediator]|uniref:uncharacterized protein LOC130667175 n=1 Tax=Microplitis mediator TaxID=375433 RepID=UPI002553C64A|nr:uncharacterized protein LOC130667175 [Microplitis mediator]
MKTEELSKQRDVLHQISQASDAIRRKHRMLKLGKDTAEKAMGEMFKPIVTPLQSLVESSKHKIKQEIKQEVKEEFKDDNSTVNNDASNYDSIISEDRSGTLEGTQVFPAKDIDMRYGIRRRFNDFYIGDSEITFDDNEINIKNKNYSVTPGLLELLFKKSSDDSKVTQNDKNKYLEIIKMTNTHRTNYKPDGSFYEDTTIKYNNYIADFLDKNANLSKGKGLLDFMIAKKKKSCMDYVYWDDPNELVDRLRLLMVSQAAGNPSHTNEIISIIEELREAGIIY